MVPIGFIHWTAGFLEGEGSFTWRAHRTCRGGGLLVSAPQVQREPLDRLARHFGGNVIVQRQQRGKWQKCYSWNLGGSKGAALMMTIYSLLSPKRRAQARKALDGWKGAPGHSWHKAVMHCPYGHLYSGTIPIKGGNWKRTQRVCRICRMNDMRRSRLKRGITSSKVSPKCDRTRRLPLEP